jgi:hypothetical protein
MLRHIHVAAVLGGLAASLVPAGCTSALNLFDPEFLTTIGAAKSVASLPGDAPTLLVAVENLTDKRVRTEVSYRTKGAGTERFSSSVEPGQRTAQALICPIEEITMGDLSNPKAVGASIVLDNGTGSDAAPIIEVEPFGVILKDQVNYNCGDAITFAVQPSSATRSGYRIFAYFQRGNGGG